LAQARSKYISQYVRRAYLCGYDVVTGQDFSHRKQQDLGRLQHLAAIFTIDVCAFAIMANPMHNIRRFADRIGNRWLQGMTQAKAAFAVSP
jgi:hypothetical protein